MTSSAKFKSGYTLVESLIYVFLVALFAVVIVTLLLTMSRSFIRFRLLNSLSSEASLVLERVTREIKQANSIASVTANPGHLTLNSTDLVGTPTTIEFYVDDGFVMVKEGGGTAASSTSSRLLVNDADLAFQQINTQNSEAVRVTLTVRQNGGTSPRVETYYATAVLRGSY